MMFPTLATKMRRKDEATGWGSLDLERAKPAPIAGFLRADRPKTGKNRGSTHKNPRKLWKTGVFPLTFAT
jgi:hypothetical protein